ncbi:expressed unknown protein [Ectocarpus siliculosus]|uniref:C3H1-type domain-containing protein n=1 Tax=Ectocarpus siliculosus TaxID=2880 RepID=D8LEY7_ECTSI|nr:expressed unknown protein [Ectocarpus siliculosus]|eukprot:CBN79807.1 expressed unknown protein [Ectocarpus siliculosus]
MLDSIMTRSVVPCSYVPTITSPYSIPHIPGVHCGFRHNEASRHTERLCNRWAAAAAAAAAAAIKARAPPCRFYARGLCTKGKACPFFHAPSAQQAPAERTAPESSRRPAPTTLRGAAAAARKAAAASGARAASGEEWRQQKGGAAGKREAGGTERPRKTVVKNSGGGLGVSVEADPAAKRRAAEILQKHRLTSSTPAKEAGSRGGMHVKGATRTQPSDKKICTDTSGQRQPRPPTGRHSGHSSTALASPPEAAEALSKGRTIPADNNGKNTGAKTGKRVGEQEEAAGAEEAPACEGAVLHAPSPKKQAIEETPPTTARAATKALGTLQNTGRAEGATPTSRKPADEQQQQQQHVSAGNDAPAVPTSCATTAAVVANDKEEILPSRSGSA